MLFKFSIQNFGFVTICQMSGILYSQYFIVVKL